MVCYDRNKRIWFDWIYMAVYLRIDSIILHYLDLDLDLDLDLIL
jgi:hypothetical protein